MWEAYNPCTVPAYVVQSFEQTLTLPLGNFERNPCHFFISLGFVWGTVFSGEHGEHGELNLGADLNSWRPYFDYDRMVERSYALACLGAWVIAARACHYGCALSLYQRDAATTNAG